MHTSNGVNHKPSRDDLGQHLAEKVYPALFDRLDTVFPEFGFKRRGGNWLATKWPDDFPENANEKRADRLNVYKDAPGWIKIHGHHVLTWTTYVNGGRPATGKAFVDIVRKLSEMAGVPFPERELTAEEIEASRKKEARQSALAMLASLFLEELQKPEHATVLAYLKDRRGLSDAEINAFDLGYFPRKANLATYLRNRGYTPELVKDLDKLLRCMRGYVVLPWHEPGGNLLTMYGRWPCNDLPLQKDLPEWKWKRDEMLKEWEKRQDGKPWVEPTIPKTYALPGAGSKASPYLFDRVRAAGHDDVVMVEGVFDAILLQARGETRACAYVGRQPSKGQLETLKRCRVRRVFLIPDPDGGGDEGAVYSVRGLAQHGITPFVVDRLPDGVDPDDFVRQHGLPALQERIRLARHGYRHLAQRTIDLHGERNSGDDLWADELIDKVLREAQALPQGRPDDLRRHLFAPVAEVTGATADDLMARLGKGVQEGRADDNGPIPKRTGDQRAGQDPTPDLPASDDAQPAGNPPAPPAERPVIVATTEQIDVNDQALAALRCETEVYQRSGSLVRVVRVEANDRGRVRRPANAPVIRLLAKARLRELLTRCARWAKPKGRKLMPTNPPDWCLEALLERGEYPRFRYLAGVTEAPTIRPDGTILDTPGWDADTGLLYEPSATFERVPEAPTREDAEHAANVLLDLVCDFPFVGPAHRSAWLASLLTPLARPAIDGPCPLFLYEACTAGSGKSLLADLVALIVLARDMPRSALADENDEVRKTITAIAIEGERLVLLDNAAGSFGCKALDEALTGRTWKDRILGKSERTGELPLDTVFYASGNNLHLKGDTHRRVIPIRLEPAEEQPELRTGFKYPDLLDHVRQQRPGLVVAALTILRAHALAGRPAPPGTAPLGSYEAWCKVVRHAVWWATDVDPCGSRDMIAAEDRGAADIAELLDCWEELAGGINKPLTAKEAVEKMASSPDKFKAFRALLASNSRRPAADPTARAIGNLLRRFRGRVSGNRRLEATEARSRYQGWFIGATGTNGNVGGESGESGECVSSPPPENYAGEHTPHFLGQRGESDSSDSPDSPHQGEVDGPLFPPW